MANNTLTPINRSNLFYSEEDFQFETDLMVDYMEEDINQTIVLYRVDRTRTNINVISQSSIDGIVFETPVELPCMYKIEESQLKSYDKKTSNGVYAINGNLTVWMMPKVLEKYETDIMRGDYIGVQIETNRMVYFVVTDDGKVNTANEYNIGAYKTGWRVIKCSPTSDYEFKGE